MNHKKVICKLCKTIISQCRCMKCDKSIVFDLCRECELKASEYRDDIKYPEKKAPIINNHGENNRIKDRAYCRGYNEAINLIKKLNGKENDG